MALSEDDAQKLRQTMMTSGWNEIILPTLERRGQQALKALVLSRPERAAAYKSTDFDTDDDVLRAIIKDCAWMAKIWVAETSAAEHNRQVDELDRQYSNAPATNLR
jgi:hypothetical protein